MMKKNDRFIGKCTGLAENGLGVVRYEGFCFFVKNALPEEEVVVHITAIKRNYGYGFVEQHLTCSPHRIVPRCSVFGRCGGCQLQHLDYSAQLEVKRQHVVDCFQRIAHLEPLIKECLGMEDPWHYRNKVQVPVAIKKKQVQVGFYRTNSHDLIPYQTCWVQTALQNRIIAFLKDQIEQLGCADVFRHLLVKHSHQTNQVMVVLIVSAYPFAHSDLLIQRCAQQFSQIQSIVVNINTRKDNVILGDQEKVVYGTPQIQEELDGLRFNISSQSFYQINPIQTQRLYRYVIESAGLTGQETVADVYCGTGTIGIFASRYAKKVIGIEVVASAIADARINAQQNRVENIEWICGDAGI